MLRTNRRPRFAGWRASLLMLALVGSVPGSIGPADAVTLSRTSSTPISSDNRFSEGALWNDVDGDGDADLVVTNILNQSNLFYRNEGGFSFTQIAAGPVVTDGGYSYGGALADFTNDGFPELVVINGGAAFNQGNFFYLNDGTGTFTKITDGAIVSDADGSWSAAAADYDGDGRLDLFVANFNQNNALYRGLGGGLFEPITTGDVVSDGGASLGSAWADYDDDGDPDLLVCNADFGAGQSDFLYRNDGGAFARILTGPIATGVRNSVGASWGDMDNDGDLDLYVTRYFGDNNGLFRNEGGGSFVEILTGPIVEDGGSSVGAAWGDPDNDGDLDLFVANDSNEPNFLYENDGNGSFSRDLGAPWVSDGGRSNSATWCDVDLDGDVDLLVVNGAQPSQSNYLYRNDESGGNGWISVRCVGTVSNRSAIGARVEVRAVMDGSPRWQVREVLGQTGYNSQSSLEAAFGLGDTAIVDTLRIRWPSGLVDVVVGLAVDQHVVITEGGGAVDVEPAATTAVPPPMILGHVPNPARTGAEISLRLDRPGRAVISLFDVSGRFVATLLDRELSASLHRVAVSVGNQPAGVYFYRLDVGGRSEVARVTVAR